MDNYDNYNNQDNTGIAPQMPGNDSYQNPYPNQNPYTYSNPGQPPAQTPGIKDYLIWMLVPGILGSLTCGIGALILMFVWAIDSKDLARANYFRASFILIGIGIVFTVILMVFLTMIGYSYSR